MDQEFRAGTPAWHDLTVKHAERLKSFYEAVIGWRAEAVEMDGYSDFNMLPPNSTSPAAGICHARGGNADLPPQWLVYFVVDDLDASLSEVSAQGGSMLKGPVSAGKNARYAVIKDPAGAVCALYSSGEKD